MSFYRLGERFAVGGRERLRGAECRGDRQGHPGAEHATVWFGATLRGDNETISIGAGSNVQDSAVMHTDPGFPLTVGAERVDRTPGDDAWLHAWARAV